MIIDYYSVNDLPPNLHEWTVDLVKDNLLSMYQQSKGGWNESEKRQEMLAPQARYLIARSASDPLDLKGFLLFQMVQEETMDDDIMANCAYCYEIQLMESARNRGLGEFLMHLLDRIGSHWKMDKVMLTVFKCKSKKKEFVIKAYKLNFINYSKCRCLSILHKEIRVRTMSKGL